MLHEHRFTVVVRKKGRRVRYQCDDCPKIGPWIRLLTPEAEETVHESIDKHTVQELRHIAKTRGLTGYSSMRRDQLLAALAPK